MTEGDGGVLTRNGVGMTVLGAEDGAVQVFVQVGTANAAPSDLDQNLARSGFGCGDVFNADVVTVVEACCLHGMELLKRFKRGCGVSRRCASARWLLSGSAVVSGRMTVRAREVEKGSDLADAFTEIANFPADMLIATPVVGGR